MRLSSYCTGPHRKLAADSQRIRSGFAADSQRIHCGATGAISRCESGTPSTPAEREKKRVIVSFDSRPQSMRLVAVDFTLACCERVRSKGIVSRKGCKPCGWEGRRARGEGGRGGVEGGMA